VIGGIVVAILILMFADGRVRFIVNDIEPRVLDALSTPAGGENISADKY